jgi:hypothetical protein
MFNWPFLRQKIPSLRAFRGSIEKICASIVILFFCAVSATSVAHGAILIDSINPNAITPRFNTSGTTIAAASYELVPGGNIGWYYTPTTNYLLTRMETRFDAWDTFPVATLPITITVYSERPSLGGIALTANTFNAFTATAAIQGTELPPLQLTAGTKYFIGFSGLDPVNPPGNTNYAIGVNYGSWEENLNGKYLSDGATTDLGAHYFGVNYATEILDGFAFGGNGTVRSARNSPILFFTGEVIPEASSYWSLAVIGIMYFVMRQYRAAAAVCQVASTTSVFEQ